MTEPSISLSRHSARDPLTAWTRRLPLPRRRTEKVPGGTRSYVPGIQSTFDTDLPWIAFHYGRTTDAWWPLWRSVRILGRTAIELECAVCGERHLVAVRMPRFGEVNPEGREHPERLRFKRDHLHTDRPHPMAWKRPLLNPAAHLGGINLELLGMRLEADLREANDAA